MAFIKYDDHTNSDNKTAFTILVALKFLFWVPILSLFDIFPIVLTSRHMHSGCCHHKKKLLDCIFLSQKKLLVQFLPLDKT